MQSDDARNESTASQLARMESEMVLWRNRAIAAWAESAERVSRAEAKVRATDRKASRLEDQNRRLQRQVSSQRKRLQAYEGRFTARLRSKTGAALRLLGLR